MKIYNTLTRQKQDFVPLVPNEIRMYVCGMTVYDYCHLGHARVLVAFDAITRYLRARGWNVTYVRNITDIDDKILKRADENGEPYTALTTRFIQAMHEDEARLGVARPDIEPTATAHIAQIIAMTQQLIDKGYAYHASNNDVYYRVAKFDGYGKLSGKNPEELLAGARIEVDEAKEDPRDFALWKAAKTGEVSWPSPWGDGRPGWHIECSAMSTCCLGESFDIHGGGPDLPFPHHENEIAQSEAATGKHYANYWMHAGAVRVNNEKMSKSLGNFFTIREILNQYHPEVVRYLLLASHYRSAINYSEENLQTARGALERFYTALRGLSDVPVLPLAQLNATHPTVARFIAEMDDDFGTPEAIAALFELARQLNTVRATGDVQQTIELATILKSLGAVLGILQADADVFLQAGSSDGLSAENIERLIAERVQAKKDKQFARADQIRDELKAQGIILEDARSGTTWRRE
ncbi:MAG: cysteine--tRNA ligase [Cellvibrionales bacterium]|jgi:cysteinyl-tRNA synthetase|nr:cysteine--tRNA ligase [Cellvibrionales bacterium]